MIILNFSILCLGMILSYLLFKKILNPISLFFLPNIIAMFIWIGSDNISKEVSSSSFTVLLISYFCYLLGVLIYYSKFENFKFEKVESTHNHVYIDNKLISFLFFLSSIGFLKFLIYINSSIGLNEFLKNPNTLNLMYGADLITLPSLWFYLIKLSIANSLFILYKILKGDRSKKLRIWFVLSIFYNISVRRSSFFYVVLLNVFLYIFFMYRRKNTKRKFKETILVATGISTVLYFFMKLQKLLNKEFSNTQFHFFGLPITDEVATVFTYIGGNFKSYDIYLNTPDIYQVPVLTSIFRYVYLVSNKLGFTNFDFTFLALPFVNIPLPFNTSLLQYYIFKEGGLLWIICFFLIIGILVCKLWIEGIVYQNDIKIFFLTLISLVLVMSIRENFLINLDFHITFILIVIVKLMNRRRINNG